MTNNIYYIGLTWKEKNSVSILFCDEAPIGVAIKSIGNCWKGYIVYKRELLDLEKVYTNPTTAKEEIEKNFTDNVNRFIVRGSYNKISDKELKESFSSFFLIKDIYSQVREDLLLDINNKQYVNKIIWICTKFDTFVIKGGVKLNLYVNGRPKFMGVAQSESFSIYDNNEYKEFLAINLDDAKIKLAAWFHTNMSKYFIRGIWGKNDIYK